MARPTKRTASRDGIVLEAIRNGNTRKNAAALAGITVDALYEWMRSDASFSSAVHLADAKAEEAMARTVLRAGKSVRGWQAALTWLERRRPEDWARTHRVEIVIRQEAERLASELGLDAAELIREAERIANGALA